jgi:hypothetical protein
VKSTRISHNVLGTRPLLCPLRRAVKLAKPLRELRRRQSGLESSFLD